MTGEPSADRAVSRLRWAAHAARRGRSLRASSLRASSLRATVLCAHVFCASTLAPGAVPAQNPLPVPPRPSYGSLTIFSPGPGPQNVRVGGNPVNATVAWDAPIQGQAGVVYAVQRWKESDLACCTAQVNGITGTRWLDEGAHWPDTYIYRIIAIMPDGRVGMSDARWAPPPPVNPAKFRIQQISGTTVYLAWDPVPAASWYQVSGPNVPNGTFQLVGQTLFAVHNLAPGTYTWTVGSAYASPNSVTAVVAPQSSLPRATAIVP